MAVNVEPILESVDAAPSGGRRALIGSGLMVAVAIGVANGLNAVFQVALARILDRDEYALLAALVAVVLIGAVPPLAFQATTARRVARSLADGRREEAGLYMRGMLRSVAIWAGSLLLLTAIAVPIAAAAGLSHSLAIAATAATVAIALAIPVAWGGLQGAGRFRDLSAATLLFAGSRFAAAVVIGVAGGGVGAIMVGVAGATALTAAVSLLPLRELLGRARGLARPAERLATASNAAAALGLTALTALATSDLLVAKLSFPGGQAGDYAAASVGARALLLIPIAVTTVLFPRVATLRDPGRERRHLLAGLVAVGATAVVATVLLWVFAEPLIDLTFGSKYEDAAQWLGPLSIAMSLYSLATVYLYHFLSLGRSRFALVVAGLLLAQIVVYAFLHSTPNQLIGIQITFAAVTLVACEAWYLWRHRAVPTI
jgi:O-antigen/teichoic acid export membrane protein